MNNPKETSIYSISDIFTDTLKKGGEVKLPVKGISMYPLIYSGRDYVIIKQTDNYKKYDIVFYTRDDGSYILHRIVGKGKDGYKLAGDFETQKEPGVKADKILGRVYTVLRGKRVINVESKGYKFYSRLWVWLMPLRPMMISMYRLMIKIRKKLK